MPDRNGQPTLKEILHTADGLGAGPLEADGVPDRYKEALARLEGFIAGRMSSRKSFGYAWGLNDTLNHEAAEILAELRRLKGEAER